MTGRARGGDKKVPAKVAHKSGKKGGRPSALDLAKRDAAVEHWRPMMQREVVLVDGEPRIVQGEAHFEARQKANKAMADAHAAIVELYRLGTYPVDQLEQMLNEIGAASRRLKRTLPVGLMPQTATVNADANPGKAWVNVEQNVFSVLAHHGVEGADDYNVLAEADDGMRGPSAFEQKRKRHGKPGT